MLLSSTPLDGVIASVDVIVSLMGKVFDLMVANPILSLFLASGLITIGFKVFKSARQASGSN